MNTREGRGGSSEGAGRCFCRLVFVFDLINRLRGWGLRGARVRKISRDV